MNSSTETSWMCCSDASALSRSSFERSVYVSAEPAPSIGLTIAGKPMRCTASRTSPFVFAR